MCSYWKKEINMDRLVYYCCYFNCISYHFANNHPFDEKGEFINDRNNNDSNNYDDKTKNNDRDRRRYSLMKKTTYD